MPSAFAQSAETSQDQTGEIDVNTSSIFERIDSWVDGAVRMIPNMVTAIIILILAILVGALISRFVRRAAKKKGRENLGRIVGKFVKAIIIGFGVLLAITLVSPSLKLGDLIAGLGVSSVAIGFAFKDILQNWLAGLLLLVRQPFEIDDQIKVGNHEGTVVRIETRATIIKTYDGRRVLIPNSDVYTSAVLVNTAHETRRSQYDVGIGYGDDVDNAIDVMKSATENVEGVMDDPGVEVLCVGLADFSVTLRVRWWTDSHRSDVIHTTSKVLMAVKTALDDAGIDMPYETQVHLLHDQTEEIDGQRSKQREGWPAKAGENDPKTRQQNDSDGFKNKTASTKP